MVYILLHLHAFVFRYLSFDFGLMMNDIMDVGVGHIQRLQILIQKSFPMCSFEFHHRHYLSTFPLDTRTVFETEVQNAVLEFIKLMLQMYDTMTRRLRTIIYQING